jgi:uncharacterized protein (TIGR02466 family)
MKEPNFELLFPTPVMFTELSRDFTKEELELVEKCSHSTNKNTGNTSSNNNYILNEPVMESLKKFVEEQTNVYIKKVYKPKYHAEAYVTQSWLNWTKPGEYHHKHEHPNSFVSGVLYINTDETKDKITFHKANNYQQLQLASDTWDIYNSASWWFNVKPKGIVIFPSSLTHHVEDVTANEVRVSLAFNTFIKGTLGDNKLLTEFINA